MNNNMNNIKKEEQEDLTLSINSWEELDINGDLLRGIFAYGFEIPSPIQKKAIKPIIAGKDIIAQAQSGTGKTATFTIGALANINTKINNTQVLVLSPTRELTTQTAKVFSSIGCMIEGLKIQTMFGGMQDKDIVSGNGSNIFLSKSNNSHVICGCPGKVFDMLKRGKIQSTNIKLIILDEADEMLSIGFKDQVYNIFQYLPNNVQIALFSATLPENIYNITNMIMKNPVKITVASEMLTLEGIKQFFIAVENDKDKYENLKNLFAFISSSQCIIYCNSVNRVNDLYEAMKEDGFPVCCIHSGMNKIDRDLSFTAFKSGTYRFLISSNVTARGIDIQQVSIVINFDLPKNVHTYLHRIGRSGRWGRKGVGINFITKYDVQYIKKIEEHYSTEINEIPEDISFLLST